MPFVAPLIAGAIGGGIVTEIAVGVGTALALGVASRALITQPKATTTVGARLSLRTEANGPRELSVGRFATAGTLIDPVLSGPSGNDRLQLVFQIADHECDALETVYVNGTAVAWNNATGAVAEFPGVMTLRWHSGAPSQTADADLMSESGGRWTASDVGTGLAYVVADLIYSEQYYPTGLPKFLFVCRGAKLYDVRKDSTAGGSGSHRWGTPTTYEWTDNVAVVGYNYLRGIWSGSQRLMGMNAPAAALPSADWIAAANVCDEAVALRAGGSEKRYRLGGVISSATSHREVVEDLKRACAGQMIETGGTVKLVPGAARTIVATITDDDLIEDTDVAITPKRPRSQLVNAVFGSFSDPSQQYEMVALPPRIAPSDEAEDGGIRLEEHYALDCVTSGTQGQRILEIQRRRGRYQRQVKVRLPSAFALIEAADWLSWTSDRYGWNTVFEVVRAQVQSDLTIALDLVEVAPAIYAWTTSDELDPTAPATVSAGAPSLLSIHGLAVSNISVANGSVARPGLHATWTAVTDPTVTSMRVEYRIQGDTVALEVAVVQPSAGSHTWVTGVQGNSTYEVRALPVCQPPRPVTWSAWVSTGASTSGQAVATAVSSVEVTSVADDSIDLTKLSPQARFELGLATALDAVQGSLQQQITDTLAEIRRVSEHATVARVLQADLATGIRVEQITRQSQDDALAQQITVVAASVAAAKAGIIVEETARVDGDSALATQITTLTATVNANNSTQSAAISTEATARANGDSSLSTQIATLTATVSSNNSTQSAAISTEATARANGDSANASAISTVSSTVAGHTSSISTMQTSIDGIRATWTVSLSSGLATGWAMLDGTGSISTFGIMADKFYVAQPGVAGGAARLPFTIGTIGGVSAIGIAGNMVIDGAITAQKLSVVSLDAISATFGALTAGTITSPDGKLFISSQSGACEIRISS